LDGRDQGGTQSPLGPCGAVSPVRGAAANGWVATTEAGLAIAWIGGQALRTRFSEPVNNPMVAPGDRPRQLSPPFSRSPGREFGLGGNFAPKPSPKPKGQARWPSDTPYLLIFLYYYEEKE